MTQFIRDVADIQPPEMNKTPTNNIEDNEGYWYLTDWLMELCERNQEYLIGKDAQAHYRRMAFTAHAEEFIRNVQRAKDNSYRNHYWTERHE